MAIALETAGTAAGPVIAAGWPLTPYAHLPADHEPGAIGVLEQRLAEDGSWVTLLLPEGVPRWPR